MIADASKFCLDFTLFSSPLSLFQGVIPFELLADGLILV